MSEAALDDVTAAEIQRLLTAGEHAAAAAALRHHGQHARAGGIYEKLFEYGAAIACYEAAGDLPAAVRVAIAHNDQDAVARLVHDAIALGQGDTLLTALTRAGRHVEIGRVYRARGELRQASQAFQQAGAHSDAAACHEELGEAREAGLLLERWLELHPDDARASLRLGRILARFGRFDDAIALLQRAVHTAADRDVLTCRAAPTMALAFLALGYDEAARAVITTWQQAHKTASSPGDDDALETPPASLDAFRKTPRAAAFSLVQERQANDLDEAERELLLAGRYLLGEPLGGGGTGQVFRAHDAFTDTPVAVKIFGAQAMQSQAVALWARELRAASNLEHPAIVKLVELNMAQGFVVTELCGEGDAAVLLEKRLREGGPGQWLLPTLQAMLSAMSACHRTGLVHGGLKPHNVFLVPGGVKLLDIGAHRLLALRATETGGLASVWPYVSPEQLFGAPASVDGDLYAIGAMAYRALTSTPPFPAAVADRTKAPVRADEKNPSVPAAWGALLEKALHKDAAQRFDSADAFLDALPKEPLTIALPQAHRLEAAADVVDEHSAPEVGRYLRQAVVDRSDSRIVAEGQDTLVARPVWLVERRADAPADADPLFGLAHAAQLWRGVQPIYDLIVDDEGRATMAVLARDPQRTRCDFAALRKVPQGLARDLAATATALQALHDHGVAVFGFDVDRGTGPIGPRLRLAPAPVLVAASTEAIAADWRSFGALVGAAFGADDDPTLDDRGRFLAALHNGRFLERDDLEALARERDAPWPRFLTLVAELLVRSAPARAVARLVAAIVHDR